MKNNPFEITFGLKPDNYISRLNQSEEIIEAFEKDLNHVYMITGVRGTGKTVLLTHVSDFFKNKKDWIVIEVISELDMLDQFASRLYDASLFHRLFDGKTFGFSYNGLSFSIKGEQPVTNVISLIEILLQKIKKRNKKVLLLVDEAVNNSFMKPFAQAFQLLLRNNYPIYLLMTGLYQNIYELQNNQSLTFLYRAAKINLEPLNLSTIASSYQNIFNIDEKEASVLAVNTKGYAYAYQVLGYLLYEKGNTILDKQLFEKYDQYLQEYVYDKIWLELSEKDKQFLLGFDKENNVTIEYLISSTGFDKKTISVYRDRLIKRGIIYCPSRGYLSLKLPRFFEFIQIHKFF